MENVKVVTKNARLEKIVGENNITFNVIGGKSYTYTLPANMPENTGILALFGVSNFVSNACAMSKEQIAEIIATKGNQGIPDVLNSIVGDVLDKCDDGTISTRTNAGSGKSVTKVKLTDALKDSNLPADLMAILAKKLGLTL